MSGQRVRDACRQAWQRNALPGLAVAASVGGTVVYDGAWGEAEGYWRGVALDRGREGILGLVAEEPLRFEPGEGYAYDNTGFYLLGVAIEAVTGTSYGAFLEERVVRPLGLRATRVNDAAALVPDRVRGYSRRGESAVNRPCYSTDNTYSAGALLASAWDLARFAASVHAGELLEPALRGAMRTPHPTGQGNELGGGFRTGLGWFLVDDGRRRFEGHGGSILGFRSALIRRPEEGIAVAVLADGGWWQDPEELALEVARSLT